MNLMHLADVVSPCQCSRPGSALNTQSYPLESTFLSCETSKAHGIAMPTAFPPRIFHGLLASAVFGRMA